MPTHIAMNVSYTSISGDSCQAQHTHTPQPLSLILRHLLIGGILSEFNAPEEGNRIENS